LAAELQGGAVAVETAALSGLMASWEQGAMAELADRDGWLAAQREAPELRAQQRQMGQSLLQLLDELGWPLPCDAAAAAVETQTGVPIKGSITLADLLRRPGFHSSDLVAHRLADAALPQDVREGAEIDIKYSGYLERQQQQINQLKRQEQRLLPGGIDYDAIGTLSREARERLTALQPTTLGQASRAPGVTPADANALLLWLELRNRAALTPSTTEAH